MSSFVLNLIKEFSILLKLYLWWLLDFKILGSKVTVLFKGVLDSDYRGLVLETCFEFGVYMFNYIFCDTLEGDNCSFYVIFYKEVV